MTHTLTTGQIAQRTLCTIELANGRPYAAHDAPLHGERTGERLAIAQDCTTVIEYRGRRYAAPRTSGLTGSVLAFDITV